MKRLLMCLLVATMTWAQSSTDRGMQAAPAALKSSIMLNERNVPVTKTDLYCGGYLSPDPVSRDVFVAGGLQTPTRLDYNEGDIIYLRGGYAPGTRVSIIREMADPNRYVPFPMARGLQKKIGSLYGEIGYATVVSSRRKGIAIAHVDFACESIIPGDLIAPFVAREPVTARERSPMDRFPAGTSRLSGHIVASRDFDEFVGAGKKVYLNLGAQKGVKPGDYFRIVRNYEPSSMDPADAEMFNETLYDDTQENPPQLPKESLGDLPRRVVGEVIVLNTRPGTATAMITFSVEEIQIGDTVELE
ncbi:MAG: hypothetical protein ABSD20_03525 [Terriglobales bacterium]|jgi:hypothetical protein